MHHKSHTEHPYFNRNKLLGHSKDIELMVEVLPVLGIFLNIQSQIATLIVPFEFHLYLLNL